MSDIEFFRVMPGGVEKRLITINLDQYIWCSPYSDTTTIIYVTAGPDIEVIGDYSSVRDKIIMARQK